MLERLSMCERPKVGIAALICKDGKFLLGRRKNAHGAGTWAPPGGHLEFGETPQSCALRETFEETGLTVNSASIIGMTNDIYHEEKKHYITIFVRCEYISGEPFVMEPEKCVSWDWFAPTDLPTPLFLSLKNFLMQQ